MTLRVVRGDVLPDTPIYDSGTNEWRRAGDIPVVRFVVEEASLQLQEPLEAWVAGSDAISETTTDRTESVASVETTSASGAPPAAVGSVGAPAKVEPPSLEVAAAIPDIPSVRSPLQPSPSFPARVSIGSPRRAAAFLITIAGALVVAAFLVIPRLRTEEAFADSTNLTRAKSVLDLGLGPIAMTDLGADRAVSPPAPFRLVPEGSEAVRVSESDFEVDPAVLVDEAVQSIPIPPPVIELSAELPSDGGDVGLPTIAEVVRIEDLLSAPTAAPSPAVDPRGRPIVTFFEVPPRVSNSTAVRAALRREYPSNLLEAGIGGRADLWFYVNNEGVAESVQLHQSSGASELDEAALRVAHDFAFTPGRIAGEPAAGWILVGVIFDRR
ncbi:MAG: TonB family protein [Gemmatimonadota bacterium]